jgi:hypothetical protein
METFRRLSLLSRPLAWLGAAAALLLTGCASLPPVLTGRPAAAPAPAHLGGAPTPTPAAPTPAPSSLPAFASVVRDAKRLPGLMTLWQRDDKVWIELAPEDFGKPFFLSPKIASGIGEAGVFGGMMARAGGEPLGRPQLVEFRRIHQQVQLVARNTAFAAPAGSAEALAVQAAFSPSLLGSSPVLSQPHPERKTVLIDANGLFVSDLLGLGLQLQRRYRQAYAFDARHSAFVDVRVKPDEVVLKVQNHYATASLAAAQAGGPSVPGTLPDARSLFVQLHYALAKLPEQPMAPRRADPRLGHFTTNWSDFGNETARNPRVRWVNRWRLEKQDPTAALSPPVKPIVFWLDRTIPTAYREAIAAGVLEWNKAFERIGFKDALVVKVQPADADFDTLDFGAASIRWMTNAQPQFGAIGPSHVDPRSGEILDADIAFESLSSRAVRSLRSQVIAHSAAKAHDHHDHASPGGSRLADLAQRCDFADQAADQLGYALDVLAARGELAPDGPEAQRFVLDYLKDTSMHEVGHALGLRHNFRASTAYGEQQLNDPVFTRENGIAGSVMEYSPINLPRPGEKGGTPFQTTLGPYDYWAIEYAYKPLSPEQEAAELARIAGRNTEPALAFATDEDNFLGLDPDALQFDLGRDPVAFARKRIEIARDLLKRQESRALKASEDYSVLRRSVSFALRDVGRAASVLTRQIGGVRTLRDFPGSGRDPLVPVPAGQQREALDLLARAVLAPDGLRISPALARRLAPDFQERTDAVFDGADSVQTDFSLNTSVADLQRNVLGQLMSDAVLSRLVDSEAKSRPGEAFSVGELYQRLGREVWSELAAPKLADIALVRRELQREHVTRLAALLLRPSSLSRSDARSLLRLEAQGLLQRLQVAQAQPGLPLATQAHLADSTETLQQALAARLQRAGL